MYGAEYGLIAIMIALGVYVVAVGESNLYRMSPSQFELDHQKKRPTVGR